MRIELTSEDLSIEAGDPAIGHKGGVVVSLDGLDGWYSAPDPIQEGELLPLSRGSTWPLRLSSGPRVVTVRLVAECSSSIDASRLCDDIGALFGKRLKLTVHDASGPRSAECYMSASPEVSLLSGGRHVEASIILTCPDPMKYGAESSVPLSGGAFSAVVGGNAPTFPSFRFEGPCTSFELSFDGRTVSWAGEGPVEIDLRDCAPSTGRVVSDDGFEIGPGRTVVSCSAHGATGATMTFRPAWR